MTFQMDLIQKTLQPGETILWQGRPVGKYIFCPKTRPEEIAVGLVLLGVILGINWYGMVSFSSWLLIPLMVLALLVFSAAEWLGFRSSQIQYALTSRRAIVAKKEEGEELLESVELAGSFINKYHLVPCNQAGGLKFSSAGKKGKPLFFDYIDDIEKVHELAVKTRG